jgi:endonuclease G, mitochondrial
MHKLLLLLLIPFAALANPIDDQCSQHVLRGAPVSKLQPGTTQYICKTNYAIHYRYDTKTAEYVVQHVTIDSITGPAKRKDDFRPDPAIPKQHQSQLSDYAGFPFDRGHLSPGADNTQNDEIMSESFFLSNMVPQVPNHNRGIWKQLETLVRKWVAEGMDIYVASGTIYAPNYPTIGANRVGIPTEMFKVIVDRKSSKAIAFILPNAPLPVQDLPKYATTIDQVELATGINFMPKLTKAQEAKLERGINLADWSGLQ